MSEIKPLVKKPFTYNGKEYGINDIWEPAGSKNDKLIIDQKRVIFEAVNESEQETVEEKPKKGVTNGSKKSRRSRTNTR